MVSVKQMFASHFLEEPAWENYPLLDIKTIHVFLIFIKIRVSIFCESEMLLNSKAFHVSSIFLG